MYPVQGVSESRRGWSDQNRPGSKGTLRRCVLVVRMEAGLFLLSQQTVDLGHERNELVSVLLFCCQRAQLQPPFFRVVVYT